MSTFSRGAFGFASLLSEIAIGTLLLVSARIALAQPPAVAGGLATTPLPPTNVTPIGLQPARTQQSSGVDLQACIQEIDDLRRQQAVLRVAVQDDDQKKKMELLQKQIDTLEKMVKLLADQLKERTATLEARSVQAARRDSELANAFDDLREHSDAQERNGPSLPANLKELFLPSETNETPLSIYGTLAFGYSKILGDSTTAPMLSDGTLAPNGPRPSTPGGFYFGEFTPDFLLQLNDWMMLEAEIGIGGNGSVSAGSFAQADFFVNDWLTIIAGRFVAPIGWYNLRTNNPWINKLPGDAPGSAPPLWMQVLPPMALLGVEAQGSFYLGCSPFKMEYAAFISNGLNVTPATPGAPTADELANLENMQNTFGVVTNSKAIGARIGLWCPEAGMEVGLTGMYNGDYVAGGFEDSISLYAVDCNYHKGNWEFRAEYGATYQQTHSFATDNIRRQGFFTQVAYRPRDVCDKYLQNVELVYRYGCADFSGIDPTTLALSSYTTPVDVPVQRRQHEIGINYYFAPRMVLKAAYQFNDEPGFQLHDNQFISELAWGF
jgi:hypothetical protein